MAPDEGKSSRRLLSFDILSRSSCPLDTSRFRPQPSKPQFTSALQQNILSDDEETTVETTRSQELWTGIDLSEIRPTSDANSLRASSPIPEQKRKSVLRSTTPDATVTASSSRNRWEQLRQHVLPVPSRSNTPPIPGLPPGVSQTPLLSFKGQPSLQKPSRLGLLGFRHVVEHAREADEARKVSQEFEKVCWFIRMPDPQKLKADSNITASSLHLSFASNTSLASDGTSTLERRPHVQTKHDLRRSQSVQSLKTYRVALTLKPLYQLLFQHSILLMDRRAAFVTLPHEALVLSTLLVPFVSTEENQRLEEERWNAIETFEIITRSWAPDNEGKGIERYLWCCKAATIPPGVIRTRILNVLRGLIMSTDNNYVISTPQCFQTLAQGLFSLLPHLRPLSSSPTAHEEIPFLMDVISQVCDGCCGELDAHRVQEEYGAVCSDKDDKNLIREIILLEGLSRCLEDCPIDSRMWLLRHVVEQYWIKVPAESKLTPLLSAIYIRTLNALSRALLNILFVPLDQGASSQRAHCVAQFIQSRFIPEMDALHNAVKPEAKMNVIKAVLELSCMDSGRGLVQWGLSLLHTWYRGTSVWKSHLELTLQEIISQGTWSNIISKLSTLIRLLPDEVRKSMVTLLLPLLYDRLVDGPPPFPCIALTNLLDTIAGLYPQIFYKPLFLCAASSKEFSIINHLCVICIVSKFLPDYWIRDAEMVSVALMSDGGKKGPETKPRTQMKTRLGQAVVMLEFIAFIQGTRHEKELSSCSDSLRAETCKFIGALEARLAILLEARERTTSLATSQRLLLCVMFREMRLLTRSLSPTSWLVQTVGWCIDIYTDDRFDPEEEGKSTIDQIQGLYLAAQDGVRSMSQRRSTMVLSKSLQKPLSAENQPLKTLAVLVAMFVQRQSLLTSVSKGFVRKAIKLLVTMSTLLTPTEYRRLCPYLWDLLRNDGDASLTAAVCFLTMQCAEKTPSDLSAVIEVDLQSSNDSTKLNAIHRIGILFNWRYQIISQQFIADRARRPFKVVRGPLAFVSTDIGSTAYIREENPNEMKDNLPAELRKRLVEIGWNHDDAPIDQHQEWIKVPISLLSSQQLDRLENIGPDVAPPPSPIMLNLGPSSLTGDKGEDAGLLRRNSSTGGPIHTLKRRAVFVPSLALVFPRLASLVFDSNLAISSAARSTMLDIMRNDPTLIGRPVLDLFAGEQKDIQSAVAILNTFFHVQKVLPYPISHYLFNNAAGFLKWASRQPEETNALQDFAHTVPILTRLVTQVSGLSIRDIRRAKIEPFLVPSGSLWFSSFVPSGPMFPRGIEPWSDLFGSLPSDLVAITTIRVSQNMLLLAMLKRNHHDVQLVRKSMSRLELPTTTPIDQSPLELVDFVPSRGKKEQINPSLTGLSLMLSRSHVMLVAQIFRSMSRHLNDRNELATLIDGLNRILLMHGDDIGIVSQVIIALMVASTRFRRLFTSGGGYALFMPALLKLYTEAQDHPGIKLAIEYGVNRFYALHHESFVFQTLDILAHVTALPHINVEPLVKSIYNLFFALRKGVLPSAPDAAGIHQANRVQEREALIMNTAEEKPQTFLTLLRRNQAVGENQHLALDLPEEYETSRLGMDDFVRLFLTVIAHDSSIIRAEQFLRLLRHLTPYLYHASSNARAILRDGIDALATLLMKTSVKLKASDSGEGDFSSSEKILENQLLEKSRSASNIMTMRLDYLALIISFVRAGGSLSLAAVLRTTELIRAMLKEVPLDVNYGISNFIPSFIRASFIRENPPPLKEVVAFLEELAPLITQYNSVIDFSGSFQTISELVGSSTYSSQPRFSHAVVSCVCASALSSCETAALANCWMSLPNRLSIVAFLAQCVFLRGANVIAEVEKRAPSYDYLAGVVFPLVLSLKTQKIHVRDGQLETWHRDAIRNAWMCLLSFAMSTCRRTLHLLERSRSQGRQRSNDARKLPLPSFLIALQIVKVIVVRAGTEISSHIPGIWLRIRAFLVEILADGDASFAINYGEVSPLPSPTNSPQSSIHLDPFHSSVSSNSLTALHPHSFPHPRIIDYSLWSFLEVLCVHRNPLVLQMKFFVMEKLVGLEHALQYRHNSLRGRHIPSTVFSKPRRHAPGMLFSTSSGSSPLIPSQSSSQYLYQNPSLVSLEAGRQPGYNILSSPHDIKGPKIVHLGPTSVLGRTPSPGRGKEPEGMSITTKIKSVALARATYKRIRTVQKSMGYENLLPMPQNQEIDGDVTTIWTQKEALDAITKETDQLLDEFEELARSLEDGGGHMDPPQMGPS